MSFIPAILEVSSLTVLSAAIWLHFGKLQLLAVSVQHSLCFAVSWQLTALPCQSRSAPPPNTCRKYLLKRNGESQTRQERMRTSERLPEHSPASHNLPCPFAHLVSPSVLGHIVGKVRPDQRQDRQHQPDLLLLLPPYFTSQHVWS